MKLFALIFTVLLACLLVLVPLTKAMPTVATAPPTPPVITPGGGGPGDGGGPPTVSPTFGAPPVTTVVPLYGTTAGNSP